MNREFFERQAEQYRQESGQHRCPICNSEDIEWDCILLRHECAGCGNIITTADFKFMAKDKENRINGITQRNNATQIPSTP